VAERVKEQEFETGFLHGWDGSDCIYYTDEKCLYYNDAEAPCHHCHHMYNNVIDIINSELGRK
jgi:hypothetical protein